MNDNTRLALIYIQIFLILTAFNLIWVLRNDTLAVLFF